MKNSKKKNTMYIFVFFQIIIMIIVSIIVTLIVSTNAEKSSIEHMKTISDGQAKMIEQYVDGVEKLLDIYSDSPEIRAAVLNSEDKEALEEAQSFTDSFSKKIENLEGIYVSEWNTHVLAHTNKNVVGIITRQGESLEKLQKTLIQSGNEVYNIGIIMSPATDNQIVSMYKGIFDDDGNPIGLVGLGVFTSGLIEKLNNFDFRGFEDAEYYMVNVNDSKYIFNQDSSKVSELTNNQFIQKLCEKYQISNSDDSGSFKYTSSENNKKYVSVYKYMSDRGWILVFDDVQSQAFNLSFTMKVYLAVFGVMIFISMMVIVYEMRRVSKKEEDEHRIKEKKHNEEMESIRYALPENSSMLDVDLTINEIISYHGEHEDNVKKIKNDKNKGVIKQYSEYMISEINSSEHKKNIAAILDDEHLLECFHKNEKDIKYSYSVYLEDGIIAIKELSVRIIQNIANENIEALVQINDISDDYYKNVVGLYLAERQFKFTTVIFINSGKGRSLANNSDLGKENKIYDYEFFRKDIYDKLIDLDERDDFYEKVALDVIKENLNYRPSYAVYVHAISEKGEKRYLKYEYQYIDKEKETVLLCVSDETAVWEIDVLTQLCNYKGFISQASYIIKNSNEDDEFSVLVTNIKWFKVLNKIFGSARCDVFLKEYAEKLKNSLLKPEIVGRFPASDHFIMLVNRKNLDFNEITNISQQYMCNDEREVDVRITCGIYNVSDKNTAVSDMVEHAIMAFKSIKDVYNIPYAVFSEMEEERYLSGKMVVSGFDKALKDGEFLPFYQPIFDAVTHKVVSAEALVRWKKNDSFIPPGMFIPALEENGSVSKVDLYISDCVTNFLKRRKLNGSKVVPVSVNLSVMDFYAAETIDGVMKNIDILVENSIVPRYEITETAWADASDNRNEIIETMRKKGTHILIDDFGSGYSSFSTIRDFSFDILKIDMGFIRKIGLSQKADGIVSSIIDMAHFIGMKVVAEGVETKAHLDFLTEHGCDYIQGYYFSKPLSEEDFEKLLDEQM